MTVVGDNSIFLLFAQQQTTDCERNLPQIRFILRWLRLHVPLLVGAVRN
jgi:hypothetical protein